MIPPSPPPSSAPSKHAPSDLESRDLRVRNLYGRSDATKISHPRLVTPPIRKYLQNEAILLGRLRKTIVPREARGYLFEVGCGTGRYLTWAANQDIAYSGIDLLSWLITFAKRRESKLPDHKRKRIWLQVGSSESLSQYWKRDENGYPLPGIALFPFNCFGNLARPWLSLRSLQACGAVAFVSTFATSASATQERVKYYRKLRLENLRVVKDAVGVRVHSDEGLSSYAYDPGCLQDMFSRYGYQTAGAFRISSISLGHLFVPRTE